MNEVYRPFTNHEREMHRLATESVGYEHEKLAFLEPKPVVKQPEEAVRPNIGILFLLLLSALIGSQESSESLGDQLSA
jgi:hypothetical protein